MLLSRRARQRHALPAATTLVVAALLGAGVSAAVEHRAAPSSASQPQAKRGLIVPQRSIDTLVLGMRPETVRARFGNPERKRRSSEPETGRPIIDWVYSRRKLVATFRRVRGNRLTLAGLSTTSRAQRTESTAASGVANRIGFVFVHSNATAASSARAPITVLTDIAYRRRRDGSSTGLRM